MSRENKEPVKCEECRFNIDGFCKRNPPTVIAEINKEEKTWGVYSMWPSVNLKNNNKEDKVMGCFAGEKREEIGE